MVMKRRTLLKALTAVPLVNTLGFGKDKDDDDKRPSPTSHKLQILLDGAFAVVIQRGKLNSVLAFSPRDKSEPHKFYFNDPDYAQASEKNFNFELQMEGLRHAERTEISPGFEDFHATVKRWKLTENFVALKLPLPDRISFAGHREQVVFTTKKTGWMPTNHILEYDVTNPAKIKLVCKELDKACAPSPDSPPGLTRFFFEVGPPRGTPEGHAVKFFNDMLEASFPELVAAYSLSEIKDKRDENRSTTARLISADMRSTMPHAHLLNASYTLDCKLGGLLVDTTAPPG
jgi:hypothetical protein